MGSKQGEKTMEQQILTAVNKAISSKRIDLTIASTYVQDWGYL